MTSLVYILFEELDTSWPIFAVYSSESEAIADAIKNNIKRYHILAREYR
jgi:hypothetical protein